MPKFQVDTEDGHSYQVETEDATPTTQGVKPNALEEKISPTGGDDNFVTSPHGLIRTGARQIVHGARELFSPGNRAQGASDVIRGAGRMALPTAIPAMAANPVTAALGLGTGAVAGGAAKLGLGAMGASEGVQNLGEDVAGLGAGGAAAHFAPAGLDSAALAGVKAAGPKVIGGGAMIGAGEGLAHVPGMEWPARIGLGYPGARQIASGLQEGYGAAKASLADTAAAKTATSRPTGPSPKWQGPIAPDSGDTVVGPVSKPVLPSGRVVGPAPIVEVPRSARVVNPIPHQPLVDLSAIPGDLSSGRKVGGIQNQKVPVVRPPNAVAPITPPTPAEFSGTPGQLPSGRVPGQPTSQVTNPRSPAWQSLPEVPPIQPPETGALPPANLPSGRVPGGIQNQTPQAAAAQDTHPAGVTQANEFLPSQPPTQQPSGPIQPQVQNPRIPPTNLQPKGGNTSPGGSPTEQATEVIKPGTAPPGETMSEVLPQGPQNKPVVQDPRVNRQSVQKHLNSIEGRDSNTAAYHEFQKTPIEDLEKLHEDATQAEDPEKYHAAITELKQMGKEVYQWAKKEGKPVPKDPYKAISVDGLAETIKRLRK
jgi:hypothetical protein